MDLLAALRTLSDYDVEFVLIGGVAAAAHGSPSVTADVDICYRRDDANLERLAAALRSMDVRVRGADDDVRMPLDARTMRAGDHFTFTGTNGDIDCIGTPAGTLGYDDLITGAVLMDFDGLRVHVAGIDDLIRMKRAAGRPKDRIELEILGALREMTEGG